MRTLHGRVVFNQAGPSRPIHHLALEARIQRVLTHDDVEVETDSDGRFTIEVDDEVRSVRLGVFDARHRYTRAGEPADERELVSQLEVPVPRTGDDLGEIAVAFWPYRPDFPVPRAGAPGGRLPQSYSGGFKRSLAGAFAKTVPARAVLESLTLLGHDRPTAVEIQARQPEGVTCSVDAETPGKTRSDAWLGDQLLNGFHVTMLVGRHADEPGRLRARIDWGDMPARTDGDGFDLTDVDVTLEDRGKTVEPVRITLRVRTPREGSWASDTTTTYVPGDAGWEAAKRVVRCQYLLQGALDGHITRGHFQTEAVCVAAFRNLRKSPIRRLLFPHLQEIVPQGHDGDSFAWGPDGILHHQSPLTLGVMQERMERLSSGWCWSTFKPRTPVHATHNFAYAANRYWDLMSRYASEFVSANQQAIEASWIEIRRFSDDLVRSSPVYRPFPPPAGVVPIDSHELDHPEVPRPVVNGVVRSTRPITTTDAPAPGDMARLIQLCTYALYTATFLHGWTHDGQYGAGGELLYATFGLRNGSIGEEADPAVLPPPKVMMEGIETNSVGINTNYGYILRDEESDVPPRLKQLIAESREAFAALGLDVDDLRSRINI